MEALEQRLKIHLESIATPDDPAHDLLHFMRVSSTAKKLAEQEGADLKIVIPAAWLHDLVVIPKNDPRRKEASRLSADAAESLLRSWDYPENFIPEIKHAIEAHSFSANITARTLEAKIVQDADRLDGLGAIGIARCFATSGMLKRTFYSIDDPFCDEREPDDQTFGIDHFYRKLFKTAATLQTDAGRQEGARRVETMKIFLNSMRQEVSADSAK